MFVWQSVRTVCMRARCPSDEGWHETYVNQTGCMNVSNRTTCWQICKHTICSMFMCKTHQTDIWSCSHSNQLSNQKEGKAIVLTFISIYISKNMLGQFPAVCCNKTQNILWDVVTFSAMFEAKKSPQIWQEVRILFGSRSQDIVSHVFGNKTKIFWWEVRKCFNHVCRRKTFNFYDTWF